MPPQSKRRWRQFSMRSLLILMLLCALGSLAWVQYIEPLRHEQRVRDRILKLGGTVNTRSIELGWFGRWVDDDLLAHIIAIDLEKTPVTDADLQVLRDLPRLQSLNLNATRIGDRGLGHLSGLPELASLELDMTDVTDAGLASLRQFPDLVILSLKNTRITNDGLAAVGQLGLHRLTLRNTRITDAGMTHLGQLKYLGYLDLSDTDIGDEGLAKLADFKFLTGLELVNTNVSEASMPLLTALPQLNRLNVEGTRIIPAAFRRAFPELANAGALGGHEWATVGLDIELNNLPWTEVVAGFSSFPQRVTVVPSPLAAQLLAAEPRAFTASLPNATASETLRQLFAPRGLRPVVRYGCVQLLARGETDREDCRMVVADPQNVSQLLSQRLYRGCPPLDALYRNQLLAPYQGANLEKLRPLLPRSYRWRLADLTAAMTDIGLKNELDKAAFADRPELLSREIFVPSKWHCNLGSALECMFCLFDIHGVVNGDTIHLRPGAALE